MNHPAIHRPKPLALDFAGVKHCFIPANMAPPRNDWEKGTLNGRKLHRLIYCLAGKATEEPKEQIKALDEHDIAILKTYVQQHLRNSC